MINIKDELMPSYRQAVAEREKKEENERRIIETGAVSFIEKIVIPEFRHMHSMNPTMSTLHITYEFVSKGLLFRNNIGESSVFDSDYSEKQIKGAIGIAARCGIESLEGFAEGKPLYHFILNFE